MLEKRYMRTFQIIIITEIDVVQPELPHGKSVAEAEALSIMHDPFSMAPIVSAVCAHSR